MGTKKGTKRTITRTATIKDTNGFYFLLTKEREDREYSEEEKSE